MSGKSRGLMLGLVLVLLFTSCQTVTPAAVVPTVTATSVATATATEVPGAALGALPWSYSPASEELFVDVDWYRAQLIATADLWNGGMGAYAADFNGCFHVDLTRDWQPKWDSRQELSSNAQSRAIYMNVEAYRAAGPEKGQRFLDAINRGVDCLLVHFRDEEYGGFYWMLDRDQKVVDSMKQGYGNVHPLMALAQAYGVTHDPEHLSAAMQQLEVIESRFMDPDYPAAVRPGFSRDFSEIIGVNNVDVFTHYFEALLALYDVTEGTDHERVGALIRQEGDFLIGQLYVDQEGFTDRGYVAYNYDEEWKPSQLPYSRNTQWSGAQHASTGHNIELAYLLSRAVERGFDERWLATAQKLLKFCQEYAFDAKYGAMQYETLAYDGKPLEGNPDNPYFIWWAQCESARAFLHLAVVRGWDTQAAFKRQESFIQDYLIDHEYGGLFERLRLNSAGVPTPDIMNKGHIWKVNYHFNMFMTEVLRLALEYPDRLEK